MPMGVMTTSYVVLFCPKFLVPRLSRPGDSARWIREDETAIRLRLLENAPGL